MKVTEVYFYRPAGNIKTEVARVSLVFDEVFRVTGGSLNYFPEDDAYCLLYPHKLDEQGKYKDIYHPLNSDLHYDTLEVVVREWQKWQADETLRMKLA